MTDSTPGNYSIDVAEEAGPFKRKVNVSFSSQSLTHEIKPLKPCTEYKIAVTLIRINDTEILCNNTGNKNKTTGMKKEDIKNVSCSSGYFCYQSDWNISSLSSKHNKVSSSEFINGSYRFKPAYEDICSDFVLKFPEENCTDFSLTISENVPVDFIDPNDINQTQPTELPPMIKTTLPPSCKDLSVEYKCLDKVNETVEPSDMKPFTDYSCTGDIKNNNTFINKKTPPVQFNIYCDFTIINLTNSTTNTSIKLNWDTKSDKCQGVLHKLTELSYDCSHKEDAVKVVNKLPDGGTCNISKLTPYKDYIFGVHAIYNKTWTFNRTVTLKTKAGTPEKPKSVDVKYPANNEITVTCDGPEKFYGPDKRYIIELDGNAKTVRKNLSNCQTDFEDLSYSTTYIVKVYAHNGELPGHIKEIKAITHYNDKALIGFLVFLIIITSVALLLVLYKIYVLKYRKSHDLNENFPLISPGSE